VEKCLEKSYKNYEKSLDTMWDMIIKTFPIGCSVQWFVRRFDNDYPQYGTILGYGLGLFLNLCVINNKTGKKSEIYFNDLTLVQK
jgi:hypothetical protein